MWVGRLVGNKESQLDVVSWWGRSASNERACRTCDVKAIYGGRQFQLVATVLYVLMVKYNTKSCHVLLTNGIAGQV